MTEQNRKYILELFKVVSTTSILVVDPKGNLKRLYCPFPVVAVVVDVPSLIAGETYFVEAVKMTLHLEEVFLINGRAYYIYYFKLK